MRRPHRILAGLALSALTLPLFHCGKAAEPVAAPTSPVAEDGSSPATTGSDPSTVSSAPVAAPETKTLFVRETLADCEGEGPMKCMQVRESPTAEWTLFYGSIEGFTYEPGYRYELRVETGASSAKGAADAPKHKPRLVEIVSKQRADGK